MPWLWASPPTPTTSPTILAPPAQPHPPASLANSPVTAPPPTAAVPPPGQPSPVTEALLPREKSCKLAFDLAFGCKSMAGRVRDVYRYGNPRDCSSQWDDFWFCLRVRQMREPSRSEAIKARARERDRQKYGLGMPSSEDVWQSRDELVDPASFFSLPFPSLSVDDEEWRKDERDKRRQMRTELGYDRNQQPPPPS